MFKSKNLFRQLASLSNGVLNKFPRLPKAFEIPAFNAQQFNHACLYNFSTSSTEEINAKIKKNQDEIATLYKQWRLKDAMGVVQENIKLKRSLFQEDAQYKQAIVGELIDLGNLNFYSAEYNTSLSFYEEAYNLVTGEFEKSEILGNIALVHRNLNNFKIALDFYKNSSKHLAILIHSEKTPSASALIKFAFNSISQAEIFGATEDKEGYENILKEAIVVLEREFPLVSKEDKNRIGVVDSMININEGLGEFYFETRKPDQGRAFFDKNIQLAEEHHGLKSIKYVRAIKNLGFTLFKTMSSNESLPLIIKAKGIAKELQASKELIFLTINLLHLEAQIYMAQNKHKEAGTVVEEFFNLKEQHKVNEKYLEAIFLNLKSDLLKLEGKVEEAYNMLEKWLVNSEKEHITQNSVSVVGKLLENVSSLAHLMKSFDKSIEHADKGLNLMEKYKMEKTHQYAYLLRVKGLSLMQLKDYSTAIDFFKRSLQVLAEEKTHMGDLDKLFLEIAYGYEKLEKFEEAVDYLEKTYKLRLKLFDNNTNNEHVAKIKKKIDDMKNNITQGK